MRTFTETFFGALQSSPELRAEIRTLVLSEPALGGSA